MSFRPFVKEDIPQLLLWFADPEIKQHLSGFDPPHQQLELILSQANRAAYVWEEAGDISAFAEIEWEEDWANLLIMVKATNRKQGLGRRILLFLQSQKLAAAYHAYISPENKASIRCFKGAGFKFVREEENMEKWLWES